MILDSFEQTYHIPTTGDLSAQEMCELPTKKYLVVDIRGPKENGTMPTEADLCILYFSAQWDKCIIQMRQDRENEVQVALFHRCHIG